MQGEQQGYIFPHVVKITTGTEMESGQHITSQ